MKRKIAILLPIILFSVATSSFAHPGRTDSNGGHTCRTNCEKWGLEYGEYHYHNGGGSTGGSAAPSNAPSQAEIDAQDRTKGENEGYNSGYEDGYAAASKNAKGTGSVAYNEGFNTGYEKGYNEGLKKLESEKITAQKEGSLLGEKNDTLSVPEKYSKNTVLQTVFTNAFNTSVEKRDKAAIAKYSKAGVLDGLKDSKQDLGKLKASYLEAYEKGFQKGLSELKSKYVKQGYNAAFKMLKYQAPKIANAKYVSWYKEGFESNKEVQKIQDEAFNLGDNGEDYSIPEKYKHAEIVYKHYYNKGLEKNKEDNTKAAAGVGIGGLAWLGRRFYVAKKSIS